MGFIPGRQGPDQIRRAIDIVSILQTNWAGGLKQPGMLLSLGLQKAFDAVSWPYIFAILERWGFGKRFMGRCMLFTRIPKLTSGSKDITPSQYP